MKKLTLTEACLMDASGELGDKATARLHEHVQKYPAALLEHEIALGNMKLLRSLEKPAFSADEKAQLAARIKAGIQQKLWLRKHQEQATRRRKAIYRALAGVSGVAAALVITGGLYFLKVKHDAQVDQVARAEQQLLKFQQQAQVTRAEQVLLSYLASVDSGTEPAPDFSPSAELPNSTSLASLVDDITVTSEDEMDFAPPSNSTLGS